MLLLFLYKILSVSLQHIKILCAHSEWKVNSGKPSPTLTTCRRPVVSDRFIVQVDCALVFPHYKRFLYLRSKSSTCILWSAEGTQRTRLYFISRSLHDIWCSHKHMEIFFKTLPNHTFKKGPIWYICFPLRVFQQKSSAFRKKIQSSINGCLFLDPYQITFALKSKVYKTHEDELTPYRVKLAEVLSRNTHMRKNIKHIGNLPPLLSRIWRVSWKNSTQYRR